LRSVNLLANEYDDDDDICDDLSFT